MLDVINSFAGAPPLFPFLSPFTIFDGLPSIELVSINLDSLSMDLPTNAQALTEAPMRPESLPDNPNFPNISGRQLTVPLIRAGHTARIEARYPKEPTGGLSQNNMFYPNVLSAFDLYGRQNSAATERVDKRIRQNPRLRRERVKLLREEYQDEWMCLTPDERQSWVDQADALYRSGPDLGSVDKRTTLLASKLREIHVDAQEAFSFPLVSLVFLPAEQEQKPQALIAQSRSEGLPSLTSWLQERHGNRVHGQFMALLTEYANYIHKTNTDSEKAAANRQDTQSDKDESPLWCNGIQYLRDPTGVSVTPLRALYRQGLYERRIACGWKDVRMPWQRVEDQPESFIQAGVLPEGTQIKPPERQDAESVRKLVKFFVAHQKGEVPWERGLLFKPLGNGKFPVQKPEFPNSVDAKATAGMTLDISCASSGLERKTEGIPLPITVKPPSVTLRDANSGSVNIPPTLGTNSVATHTANDTPSHSKASTTRNQQTRELGGHPRPASTSNPSITSYFHTLSSIQKPTQTNVSPTSNGQTEKIVRMRGPQWLTIPSQKNRVCTPSEPLVPSASLMSPKAPHKRTATEAGIGDSRPPKLATLRK